MGALGSVVCGLAARGAPSGAEATRWLPVIVVPGEEGKGQVSVVVMCDGIYLFWKEGCN